MQPESHSRVKDVRLRLPLRSWAHSLHTHRAESARIYKGELKVIESLFHRIVSQLHCWQFHLFSSKGWQKSLFIKKIPLFQKLGRYLLLIAMCQDLGQWALWLREPCGESVAQSQVKGTFLRTVLVPDLRPANMRQRGTGKFNTFVMTWPCVEASPSPQLSLHREYSSCEAPWGFAQKGPAGILTPFLLQADSHLWVKGSPALWVMCRDQKDDLTMIPSTWTVNSLHFLISLLMVACSLTYVVSESCPPDVPNPPSVAQPKQTADLVLTEGGQET